MKKLIIGIIVMVGLATQAQTFRPQSFLAQGVASLYVTNLVAITNLNTAGANLTNAPGTAWSNYTTGVSSPYTLYVTATNAAVVGAWTNATKNLLKDVDLWVLKDGSMPVMPSGTNGTDRPTLSYASLSIRIATGGSGAATNLSLVFTPLLGPGADSASAGVYPKPTAVEGAAGDEWTVGITSAGAASVTVVTNVPLYKWPGARGLRLRRIVNPNGIATSHVIINDVTLNGYIP